MKPRARAIAFVVGAAVIAAVCAATCSGEDAPTSDPAANDEGTVAAGDPGGADADRVSRRRVDRTRSRDARTDAAQPGAADVVEQVPPSGADYAETGRVHVTLLKEGKPLEGARVFLLPWETFTEPAPWDGTTGSDGAYFGIPHYVPLWQHFDPALRSRATLANFWIAQQPTGPDGLVTIAVPADRELMPHATAETGIALVSHSRIVVERGGELDVTLVVAQVRSVTGRCLDSSGKPLSSIAVQAISPLDERPISWMVQTAADGAFELAVVGDDPEVRVRAAVAYPAHSFGFYASEEDVAPIPALTTVPGVVPGTGPVDVRMADAPLVFIELTVADGESPLMHLQIEGLAFDPRSSAWGRLGGPQYRAGRPGRLRAVIALPRSEAVRPLMLWSWGWTITGVDPRGQDRVSVEIPRGRRASVRGKGWRASDRLRVVAWLGPAGQELPCVWIDGPLGKTDHWARNDSPVSPIEFHIVRDGVVVGRSPRVPAGTGPADEVTIDLE